MLVLWGSPPRGNTILSKLKNILRFTNRKLGSFDPEMYSRVPLEEGGSVSTPRRLWLPWVAFAVGILATVGYYERKAFSTVPPVSDNTDEPPLSQPSSWSYFPLFQHLFEQSPDEAEEASPSSLESAKPPKSSGSGQGGSALQLELENTRSSLFTAQRVADQRGSENQELRSELDGLRAASSSTLASLSQCKKESSSASTKATLAADDLSKKLLLAQQQQQQQAAASGSSSPAAAAATTSSEFDIDTYRAARLAATQPNIIECAEAGEGNSNQEACHLPPSERFPAIGQKGATLWMTGLSGAGKSTVARALERKLVRYVSVSSNPKYVSVFVSIILPLSLICCVMLL
jgi:hypothetical protein